VVDSTMTGDVVVVDEVVDVVVEVEVEVGNDGGRVVVGSTMTGPVGVVGSTMAGPVVANAGATVANAVSATPTIVTRRSMSRGCHERQGVGTGLTSPLR